MIDASPQDLTTVKRILAKHLPECEVRAFGSRVSWTAKPYSDLDLVVLGPKKLSRKVLILIKSAFEESAIPITVDVLDWHRISPEFRENIEKEYETIQTPDERNAIPEGWRFRKVSEIAEVVGGGTPKTKKPEYWGGDIPWLTPKDLSGEHFRYVSRGERNITKAGIENSSARLVPPGTVLLTSRAPVGYVAMAKNPIATNQGFRSLVVNEEHDPDFIYYLLLHNTDYLKQHASGSTFQELSGSTLKSLEFLIPPLSEQRAIAHILGSLDDKIELNQRMNKTLEAMARAIFKSWFIDFDPVIDNAFSAGNPIPERFAERVEMRRQMLDQNQPSSPGPFSQGEKGGQYRGKYDFSGLLDTTRELRKNQTTAENLFWGIVRNRRFLGLKFRRQHQVGDYVVDFYCHEHRLVIELDGGIHNKKLKKDAKRDAYMESLGFTVLRFSNSQVFEDIEGVLAQIAACISPSPSGRGGGEGSMDEIHRLFPDSFQDSDVGEIPKEWEIKPIGEAVRCVVPPTPSTKKPAFWNGGKNPFVTPKDMSSLTSSFIIDTARHITDAGVDKISSGRLPAGTVLLSSRAPIGYLAITEVPVSVNQGIIAMICDKSLPNYHVLYWTEANMDTIKSNAGGTTFAEISKRNFRPIQVIVPHKRVLEAYVQQIEPLHQQIVLNLQESSTLASLRYTLLPKLISGELRLPAAAQAGVSDVEKFVEPACAMHADREAGV